MTSVEIAKTTGNFVDFPGQGEHGLGVSASLGGLQIRAKLPLLLFESSAADGSDGLLNMGIVRIGAVDGDEDAGKELTVGGFGKRLQGIGIFGSCAELAQDFMDIRTHGGEVWLVLAPRGSGDAVSFTILR